MIVNLDNREKAVEDLTSLLDTVRSRRQTTENEWLDAHSAWRGKHTKSFYKSETFNHYVPLFRRAIERYAKRGAQMVVPSDTFFEVYPAGEMEEELGKNAESVLLFLSYWARKRIRVYSLAKQWFRTFSLYGRAISKTSVMVSKVGGKKTVWPTTRAVDPFQFYIWPETATELDKATLIAEDFIIPLDEYRQYVDSKVAEAIDESKLTGVTWPSHLTRRLQDSGVPEPHSTSTGSSVQDVEGKRSLPKEGFVQGTEAWLNMGSYWRVVWIVWNLDGGAKITRVGKKSYDRPAYRMVVDREIPGEHYTTSMGTDLEPVQVLNNDAVNMYLESSALEMAGPVAIDPLLGRTSGLHFRPRAKWLIPPDAVREVYQGTRNATRSALSFFQFSNGLMDAFSGSSPLAEGNPIRNMPRAGFAVSSLLSMSLADIRDAAKSIEDDLLAPMLSDAFKLTMEYVPDTQIFSIPGTANFPKGRSLDKRELEGDWDFLWIGTLQSQDYQEKAQRLGGMMANIAKMLPIIQPELARQGKQINWAIMLKRLWRYSLGEHGADSIIGDLTPEQMAQMQAMAMMQAQQGGQDVGA